MALCVAVKVGFWQLLFDLRGASSYDTMTIEWAYRGMSDPFVMCATSASAKNAVAHFSVWHFRVGRFGFSLLAILPAVRALGLNLWSKRRYLPAIT